MILTRLACLIALSMASPVFAGTLIIVGEPATPAVSGSNIAIPPLSPPPPPFAGGQAAGGVAGAAVVRTWRIESSDVRLSTTFERWSKEAGHNLIWDAEKQVLLSAKDQFTGTLEQAIDRALSSPAIRRSEFPMEACFYPNSPPVIRVTRLGEQAEECPR